MQVFKKYFLQIFLILIVGKTAMSQENFIAGGGSSLEINESIFGANLRTYYGLNKQFCFGPEVSYFPFQRIDDEYQLSIIDLNFNAHYIFEINHKLGIYPLSGLNYSIEKERLIDEKATAIKENEWGLNYGLGLHYKFNHYYFFSEFNGIAGQLNDHFITLGVIFSIKRFKKEENHNN